MIITGILSVLIQPWKLANDPTGYIYDWLGTCGLLTGPIAGIMICDFYIIKRKVIALNQLYSSKDSKYWYTKGTNYIAIIAWLVSILIVSTVKYIPFLSILSINGWVLGFALAFILYYLLNAVFRKMGAHAK